MRIAAASALLLPAVIGCACSTPAEPQQPAQAPTPAAGGAPLVRQGQDGRAALSGRWLFRLDADKRWRPVSIPHDWNGSEAKLNKAGVGWYRRKLKLARGRRWIARFEGAGHTTTVYANGRRVGRHVGNYLPFEVDLPAGRTTLTVRVSSLRTPDDLTHWRRARFHRWGNGGWWNFGGIHREITIRPAYGLDISRAQALPQMACPSCPARVRVLAVGAQPVGSTRAARADGPRRGPDRALRPGHAGARPAARAGHRADHRTAAAVGHRQGQSVRPGRARRAPAPARARRTARGSGCATCARTPRGVCS